MRLICDRVIALTFIDVVRRRMRGILFVQRK